MGILALLLAFACKKEGPRRVAESSLAARSDVAPLVYEKVRYWQEALNWLEMVGELPRRPKHVASGEVEFAEIGRVAMSIVVPHDQLCQLPVRPDARVRLAIFVDGYESPDASAWACLRAAKPTHVGLSATDVAAEAIEALAKIDSLRGLGLDNTRFTSEAMVAFAKLTTVEELYLAESNVDGRVLQAIENLPRLRRLDISHTNVRRADLARIASFAAMEQLDIESLSPSPAQLRSLSALKKLRQLTIGGKAIAAEEVSAAVSLTHLNTLAIRNTEIVVDTKAIATAKQLRALDLSGARLADADIAPLVGLRALEKLTLQKNQLSVAVVSTLNQLPLRYLDLSGIAFERGDLAQLNIPTLRHLNVNRVPLAAKDLSAIARHSLETLSVRQTHLLDQAHVKALANMHSLRAIDIGFVFGDALAAPILSRLPNLELVHAPRRSEVAKAFKAQRDNIEVVVEPL